MLNIAICYDFDGTLAPGNMQEYEFIPNQLGIKPEDFWKEVQENAKKNDMDEILSYLELTLKKAKEKGNVKFNQNAFKNYGEKIKFFDGVVDWFKRINEYARGKSIEIEHYIISSGIKSIIEGSTIASHFKHIFACDFKYDANGVATFPSAAINYTTKTQYLFRINKNKDKEFELLNNWNNDVNKYTKQEDRPIPFNRMIYLGDGLTDVPAMKMINLQNGYSIGVYDPQKKKTKDQKSPKEICQELLKHERCSFIAPADYSEEKDLDRITKFIIDKIYIENQLKIINKKSLEDVNDLN